MACVGSFDAAAISIEFDYRFDTRGFFTDEITGAPHDERRSLLERAASHYAGFTDTLAAISPGAGNSWSVSITHPSLGGPAVTLVDEFVAADELRIFVGGSPSAPGVLGFAGNGSDLVATGDAEFVTAVESRGQMNSMGPAATDVGPWGGYIWFNANNDWYFGTDETGLTAGRPDFLTTATHEIGHILGFGEAESWFAQIGGGFFNGAAAVAVHDGAVPVDVYGAHWAEGTFSTYQGTPQEAMMDPSTPRGERQLPTALDYAGFADIGWQVSPVPLPGVAWLFCAACGALVVRRRSGDK